MQADLYARFAYDAFSLNVTLGVRGDRRARRTVSIAGRSRTSRQRLDLARALPHVAAQRDRALRARRALLRALRPPLRRAHLLRAALHRLQPLRGDLQRRRAATSPTTGRSTPPRSRPSADQLPRLRSAPVGPRENGGAAYGEKRFNKMAAAGPAVARRHRQRRGALPGRRGRQALDRAGAGCCSWARPTSSASSSRRALRPEPVRLVSRRDATSMRGLMLGVAYERFQEDLAVKRHRAQRL